MVKSRSPFLYRAGLVRAFARAEDGNATDLPAVLAFLDFHERLGEYEVHVENCLAGGAYAVYDK